MTLVKRRDFLKNHAKAATKGSQLWLQLLVGEPGNRWLLDAELAKYIPGIGPGDIEWRSPIDQKFSEYRDGAFLDALDLAHLEPALVRRGKSTSGFWPARGPVWDGLAVGPDGLKVLVEAKAHVPEIAGSGTGASPPSRKVIDNAFAQVKKALGVKGGDWTGPLYQHANRVAHLWWLRQQDVDAHLVFLYFIGADQVGGPTSRAPWEGAIELEERVLGLPKRHPLRPFVHHVFFDVTPLKP
jgi:hypothetical protein